MRYEMALECGKGDTLFRGSYRYTTGGIQQ